LASEGNDFAGRWTAAAPPDFLGEAWPGAAWSGPVISLRHRFDLRLDGAQFGPQFLGRRFEVGQPGVELAAEGGEGSFLLGDPAGEVWSLGVAVGVVMWIQGVREGRKR